MFYCYWVLGTRACLSCVVLTLFLVWWEYRSLQSSEGLDPPPRQPARPATWRRLLPGAACALSQAGTASPTPGGVREKGAESLSPPRLKSHTVTFAPPARCAGYGGRAKSRRPTTGSYVGSWPPDTAVHGFVLYFLWKIYIWKKRKSFTF